MTLEDAYFISQIIAATAIVASLIFVGVQLRQSERTQRAAMHQGRTQRGMDMALRSAEPHIVDAIGHFIRMDAGATPGHFMQANALLRAMVLNLDDVAWQHKAGMLDKAVLDNTIAPMQRLFSIPGLRALWLVARPTYAPKTVALVDDLVIAGAPLLETAADPIAIWRAIASQSAPGSADVNEPAPKAFARE
jgi:hypothetical protein